VRQSFERQFGQDFSRVRIHTGESASQSTRALAARAYTAGEDIVFRDNNFDPSAPSGRRLLAHELAHVVQQRGGSRPTTDHGCHETDRFEQEAEQAAEAIASNRHVQIGCTLGVPALQCYPMGAAKPPVAADPREEIIRLAESNKATDRQRALDMILATYYKRPPALAAIVYDPDFVAHRKAVDPRDIPQDVDTGGGYGEPQTITVGPHFFHEFRERYAQRVRTIGHELQHVEQRAPSETEPGKRSVGSTLLGGLAGAAAGAAIAGGALAVAAKAGANLSGPVIGGVLGGAAALGGIAGAIWDPFRPKQQTKEPIENKHTREFLAIYWTVTAEVPGLEQMALRQRIRAITEKDKGALAEYAKMPLEDQKRYAAEYVRLRALLETLRSKQHMKSAVPDGRGDFPGPEPPVTHSDEVAV